LMQILQLSDIIHHFSRSFLVRLQIKLRLGLCSFWGGE
jgi:hypothetical protein